MNIPRSREVLQTIFYALFLLFFIQLLGIWIESIYRVSLLSLSPGAEMAGLALVLLPLLLYLVPQTTEPGIFRMAVVLVVLCRLACPVAPFALLVPVAGLGVGASLVVFCYLFSNRYRLAGDVMGRSLALALLLCLVFRVWGSSVDITYRGPGALIALLAGITILALLFRNAGELNEQAPTTETSMPGAWFASFGFFSGFVFIFFGLSSPAAMSAWTGASYPAIVLLLVAGWCVALAMPASQLNRVTSGLLSMWNLAFGVSLVFALWLHTPAFPQEPGSPVLNVGIPSIAMQLPLYIAMVLSPVIYLNIRVLLDAPMQERPRAMALPVTLGGVFVVAMSLLLIFSNVWAYVKPISPLLRGKFYLPFLLCAIVMTAAVYLLGRPASRRSKGIGQAAWVSCGLAFLILLGLFVREHRADARPADAQRLTIATYNMQLGSHRDGPRNLSKQLEVLREIDADIIGLQESDASRPSGGNIDPARYFADALGYYHYFGPTSVGGTFGTAIISRYPLENPHTIYSFSDRDETATAVVEVEVGGRRIAILNSHPAGKPPAKQAHVDALIAEAGKYEYAIAIGDYNFRQDSTYYRDILQVMGNAWQTLYPDGTGNPYPKRGVQEPISVPRGPIDHIFYTDGFDVDEAWYLLVPESQTDHPAHWAVLSWGRG